MKLLKDKNTILALVIEDNTNNGEWNNSENLEGELELCVKSWKKYYPNMRIVGICPSNKVPKNIPKEIEFYHHDFGYDFECGYFNIPLGLKWIEDNIECDVIIHIDLDMQLLKHIPDFELKNADIIIGRLNDIERKTFVDYEYTFESNYIIVHKNLFFFTKWWEKTSILEQRYRNIDKMRYIESEELAIDEIYNENIFNIKPIIDYQFGKRYPIENIKDKSKILFKHQHIGE